MDSRNPDLFGQSEASYGTKYKDHLLDQYKVYLEMADRISHRRQVANTFILSINTAIVTLCGILLNFAGIPCRSIWLLLTAGAGVVLSYVWYRLVRSYKDLNSAKFAVIHEIENALPIQPYAAEWKKVGEGKDAKLYLPFTHIETNVPWVFGGLYLAAIVFVILSYVAAAFRLICTCITSS